METLFEERQYLGFNKFSMTRRTVFAIFCFAVYFFSENEDIPGIAGTQVANMEENTSQIFFLMGMVILIWSIILIFILHIKTHLVNGSLILDGLWTAKKVKIDLNSIDKARKIRYSRYLLNRPVYNLHRRGRIKFYTMGADAVELTDKDGLIYVIGSQKADELLKAVKMQLNKASNTTK